ncbi:hypothetical protein QE152_g19530 [Popillia japonica]|uniref:Uncharacterized protein n=1 Tax=Popillia japonica TaxID=7064 RepID=A0AAW1KSQ3_POPJA
MLLSLEQVSALRDDRRRNRTPNALDGMLLSLEQVSALRDDRRRNRTIGADAGSAPPSVDDRRPNASEFSAPPSVDDRRPNASEFAVETVRSPAFFTFYGVRCFLFANVRPPSGGKIICCFR